MQRLLQIAALIISFGLVEAQSTQAATNASNDDEERAVTPAPKRKRTTAEATPRKTSATATPKAQKPATPGPEKTASSSTQKKSTTDVKHNSETDSASSASTKKGPTAQSDAISTSQKSTSETGGKPKKSEISDTTAKTTAAVDPAAPPAEQVPAETNASLASSDLAEFAAQPPRVQKLIESALALTRRNLTYSYGSADPANGGMDCSGFVYYVLRENGFTEVPRPSNEQYVWVRKADEFDAVLSKKKQSFELDALKPGDLLFWTGTYTIERDPPVTHSMIYLGTEKRSGQRVMVGSSDGRTYRGKSRWGVSVFDFQGGQTSKDPSKAGRGGFVGYATIPGIRDETAGGAKPKVH